MAIEIVSFPIKNGGSFHSYVKLPEGIKGHWDVGLIFAGAMMDLFYTPEVGFFPPVERQLHGWEIPKLNTVVISVGKSSINYHKWRIFQRAMLHCQRVKVILYLGHSSLECFEGTYIWITFHLCPVLASCADVVFSLDMVKTNW